MSDAKRVGIVIGISRAKDREDVKARMRGVADHHMVDGWENMTLEQFAEACATNDRKDGLTAWWEDPIDGLKNVASLIRWLDSRGELTHGEEVRVVLEILGKPWKWSGEYAAMIVDRVSRGA